MDTTTGGDSENSGYGGGSGAVIPTNSNSNQHHYYDALEDVHTRFILNLPDSELTTADRIFFQLEQAWWYYEDWICDIHPEYNLPRYTTFKLFAKMMFDYSPILPKSAKVFTAMWTEYSAYRRSISNYGCILLSVDYQYMVLCQVYNSKTLTFPSGKINHGEDGPTAAARETYEETGFDPFCQRGLTAQWKDNNPTKITWNTTFYESEMLIQHEDSSGTAIVTASGHTQQQQQQSSSSSHGKRRIVYVVVGVPKDFPFAPVCRKEISDILWYPVYGSVPKPSYGVIPFLQPLKKYIQKHKNQYNNNSNNNNNNNAGSTKTRDKSTGSSKRYDSSTRSTNNNNNNNNNTNSKNATPKKVRSRNNSRGRNISNPRGNNNNNNKEGDYNDLIQAGLTNYGEDTRWSVEDMFRVNEKLLLTDTKSNYDGNPYIFAEQGFVNGIDPHAFRIVGGAFLNQQQQPTNEQPPNNQQPKPTDNNNNDDDDETRGIYHLDRSTNSYSNKQPRSVSRLQAFFNTNNNNSDIVKNSTNDPDGFVDKTSSTSHRDSLNNEDDGDDGDDLKPFFSTDGTTPWGEVVEGIKTEPATTITNNYNNKKSTKQDKRNNNSNNNKSSSVGRSKQKQQQQQSQNQRSNQKPSKDFSPTILFQQQHQGTTQGNATATSQIPPLSPALPPAAVTTAPTSTSSNNSNSIEKKWKEELLQRYREEHEKQVQQYEHDLQYIEQWVFNLPKPAPTKLFGTFRFDPDKITQLLNPLTNNNNHHENNNNVNNASINVIPSSM